jgi:hypothetical protein
MTRWERNSQACQNRQRVRHQTLAAGLIDRRQRRVRDRDAKTARAQGNRRSQSSRPSTYNKYVALDRNLRHD